MLRRDIYVYPSSDLLNPAVMEGLANLTPVRFNSCADLSELEDGAIILDLSGDRSVLDAISGRQLRALHVTSTHSRSRSEAAGKAITFTTSDKLDSLLRGRTIAHRLLEQLHPLPLQPSDEVLARYGEEPVWVSRPNVGQILSAALPQLADGEQPFDYLNGYHFIQLLPVLHFLREVTADLAWTRPPLRACFMFDDPNLHWPSYGFLRYDQVAEKARVHNYHVAFATVPFDMWCSHSGTVGLFQANQRHLSLIIHGNNHTHLELGQTRTKDGFFQLVGQSLSRIEKFERSTNLHVDRVIVPPHEAFLDAIIPAMVSLGVEGVSLAPWSLRYWNPEREWPSTFGLESAEMMDGGFPVLPRYELSESCDGIVSVSAFLGSPILLSGHHTDVAGGLEVLSTAAKIINSLGDVQWCSAESILRSNYLQRLEAATLFILPFSSRIEVRVPEGATSVVLAANSRRWHCDRTQSTVVSGEPVDVTPGETIRFASANLATMSYQQLDIPGLSPVAASRRLLCELRDRLSVLSRAAQLQ